MRAPAPAGPFRAVLAHARRVLAFAVLGGALAAFLARRRPAALAGRARCRPIPRRPRRARPASAPSLLLLALALIVVGVAGGRPPPRRARGPRSAGASVDGERRPGRRSPWQLPRNRRRRAPRSRAATDRPCAARSAAAACRSSPRGPAAQRPRTSGADSRSVIALVALACGSALRAPPRGWPRRRPCAARQAPRSAPARPRRRSARDSCAGAAAVRTCSRVVVVAQASASASASPRTIATSSAGRSRDGTGSRASWPRRPAPSGAKATAARARAATARIVAPVTCRKASIGPSFVPGHISRRSASCAQLGLVDRDRRPACARRARRRSSAGSIRRPSPARPRRTC